MTRCARPRLPVRVLEKLQSTLGPDIQSCATGLKGTPQDATRPVGECC